MLSEDRCIRVIWPLPEQTNNQTAVFGVVSGAVTLDLLGNNVSCKNVLLFRVFTLNKALVMVFGVLPKDLQ